MGDILFAAQRNRILISLRNQDRTAIDRDVLSAAVERRQPLEEDTHILVHGEYNF